MPPKKKEEVKTKPLLGRFKSNLKVRKNPPHFQTLYTVDAHDNHFLITTLISQTAGWNCRFTQCG